MIGIYRITSPKGDSYIGQTTNFNIRISTYRILHCKGQPRLYRSMKKYGFDKHHIELIHECDESLLNHYEEFYIEYFNTISPNGLNLTSGGSNGRPNKETRSKMSKSKIGKMAGEYHPMWGKKHSEESKKKTSKSISKENHPFWGKRFSLSTRKKMSESQSGRVINTETKMKMSEAQKGEKNHNYGTKMSADRKRKLSEGMKKYWEKKKRETQSMAI